MNRRTLVAAATAALMILPASAAFADGHDTAQVTIVHGVPGADGVSILADDDALLEDVDFTDIVTTDVPAGTYSIAVSTSDSVDDAVIGPVDLSFEAGSHYAVVAHLDADGGPTASLFDVNDAEGISAFHTAAFPAVAIVAGGEIQADDLTNGNAAQLDLAAGTELADVGVAAAGDTALALEAGDVTIPEDQRILAFAIGTPEDDSLQLVTTVVDVSAATDAGGDTTEDDEMERPTSVEAGSGGLLGGGPSPLILAALALGLLLVAAPVTVLARQRR